MEYKERAEALFFIEKKSVSEVAEIVGRRYETVLRFLESCDGYADERASRKNQTAKARKSYKEQWEKSNRNIPEHLKITGDSLRQEHYSAVSILSREKYGDS
ncbi:hypothetical protein AGMMS49975_30130 [Clostridia bacterium]|nr:hypothetical protein AGMMS49975_30130 [Clostridia bacterium]